MAPWLALSLGLWLGQAPEPTPALQREVEQLRTQLQELQAQVDTLEEQLTGMREGAAELERLRQQRLEEIARAGGWLVAADRALAVGDADTAEDALAEADAALVQTAQSATAAGGGRTVLLVEGARNAIFQALEAVGRRDNAQARWWLFDASEFLREARRNNLEEPGSSAAAGALSDP